MTNGAVAIFCLLPLCKSKQYDMERIESLQILPSKPRRGEKASLFVLISFQAIVVAKPLGSDSIDVDTYAQLSYANPTVRGYLVSLLLYLYLTFYMQFIDLNI